MPVHGSGNLLSVNCDSNRVNARMGCRIQLSPTSGAWILPGRAVASADKLLYETRSTTMLKEVTESSDGASALPSRRTGYGTAGAHEERSEQPIKQDDPKAPGVDAKSEDWCCRIRQDVVS
ncbi:hypothetical protein TRIUR3_17861 [Triticum urartu]|uniref:Uncharacterized protein n=1 Tax=Triticum urartu TaxID=4572 RepID=M7YMY6_TRIUA|nr:hypothetical protein TRIUR3_17861 [Triticum urartu]